MKKDIRRTMGTMGVSGGDDGGDGGSLYDADDAETDSFFSVKEKTTEEETEHQDLIEEAYAKGMTKAEKTAASKEKAGDGVLDRARAKTFGDGEDGETELTGDDFLHDYVANQGWLETKAKKKRRRGAGAGGDEDLDAVDAAEKFEHAYNFRFEEGNTEITGHSRDIKDVARRPDDRRKRKRAEKAAKKAALREEATSELKRLKNLKRAELEAKLKAVHDVAGLEKPNFDDEEQSMAGFNMDDLDGDFDPASWDAKMSTVFGEQCLHIALLPLLCCTDITVGVGSLAAQRGSLASASQGLSSMTIQTPRLRTSKTSTRRSTTRTSRRRMLRAAVMAPRRRRRRRKRRRRRRVVGRERLARRSQGRRR